IQRWLAECDSTHQRCKTGLSGELVGRETTLPTRLLFVGLSPDSKRKLTVTEGLRGTYTTLSHRWGSKALVQTTRANLSNHQQGVGLEKLPKTFEDAIKLTQMIGVPYIWIDSLCIIQDDPQDWANEARQMGAIYERSYLTIAASSGVDSKSGLY
ncbi:heterokaryon incompatibility protein-domain-containing protein, partial [Apiosordaria backusii]